MTRFPQAVMTHHARERLAVRSALEEPALLDMLDRGLAMRVSVSKYRSHLAHRLYWSQQDKGFYLAVQDVISGSVLTVLTAEMFDAKYPGSVTEKRCNKVLNKAVLAGQACPSNWRLGVETRSYASVRLVSGSAVLDRTLGRWQAELPEPSVVAIGAMKQFWRWVMARVRDRQWPLEALETVRLRLPFGEESQVPYLC